MNGLAGYGSDSDISDTEIPPVVVTVAKKPQQARSVPLPKKIHVPPPVDFESNGKEARLNLPKASLLTDEQFQPANDSEDEIDASVRRKDWEVKLAEKEKKNFKKTKKRIDAFGGLSKKAVEDVDKRDYGEAEKVQKPVPKPLPTGNFTSSLLSFLPAPKSSGNSDKPKTSSLSFTPSSIKPKVRPVTSAPEAKRQRFEDDEEPVSSTSNDNDFFGLGSVTKKDLVDVTKLPRPNLPQNMFVVDEDIGPARPPPVPAADQEEMEHEPSSNVKRITDDQARKLIYKHEVEQWGASNIIASEAVRNIVEVNVDQQLGPNVRETLLKNLDHSIAASYAVGRNEKQAVKGSQDRLAKSKHQITHLASLAVAREDQLKEQWAQNKAAKNASKRKYGF